MNTETLTPHERFLRTMSYKEVDRPILWEWGPWPTALRRWKRENPEIKNAAPEYAECDSQVKTGVDLWMIPKYEEEEIEKTEEYIVRTNIYGQTERIPASPDALSMPEFLDYPVKTPDDWKKLKKLFSPDAQSRFPEDWDAKCASWRNDGRMVIFSGRRAPSFFGFVRELMGAEGALLAFYDYPRMVEDMMDTMTDLVLGVLPKIAEEAPLTLMHWWEDMSCKTGPLISPEMVKKFMVPRYRKVTDAARSLGIDHIFLDSDGDVSELIPLWLDAGITGLYPFEVASGMDVVKLRKEYGRDLLMRGGIDKRVLARGKEDIDKEIEYKIPLAHEGGYIPHIDHAIPHDVSYENFAYYWKRKKELLGITSV